MKVAYLLGSLNRGGTETLLLDVFRNATNADYQMIGIYRHGGAYLSDFQQTKVPFFHCPVKRFRVLSYFYNLRKLLLNNDIQIVHAQQSLDCLYAKFVTIGTGIKIVETFHGYDFETSWLNRRFISMSMRLADRVCFVSKHEKFYYLRAYNRTDSSKYQVVYNGIDFSKFDIDYPLPEFFSKIEPAKPEIRMAMVGNFVSVRSQSVICKAIYILSQRGIKDFEFYFVGKRNENEPWRYDDCVKFCEEHHLDNVHFIGGRNDVPAILQNIDVFVYSTDHDTFGIAVIEAIASGIPVIVNDWDVMTEITDNGKYAIIYKSNDANDCATKIEDVINNLKSYKIKATDNSMRIRERYAIQQHIQNLSKIYSEILIL